MKIALNMFLLLFVYFIQITLAQDQADSLINVETEIDAPVYNEDKSMGYQQNINLSFVHYYSDFFRDNAMGSHMNLGYGIKPKLKNVEIVVSIAYSRIRAEENSMLYDQYNKKYLLISTLGIGYCIPIRYHQGLMELRLSTGPQAMTFIDVKTVYGVFAGINIRFYFPSSKSHPNIKYGIYSEFRDHTYSLFGGDYFWDEYLKSKKEHVARDGIFLLGFILGFGDFE